MRLPSLFPSTPAVSFALSAAEIAQMTHFLQRLVQTPSPSSHEGDLAALIRQELHAIGVADVFTDRAGSVFARLGSGIGPTLVIDAHMDTVAPTSEWPHDPYAATIRDGYLYGLGAADNKGPIAAMLYGARRLIESNTPLNGNLVLAFVVQQGPCEGAALKVLLEEAEIHPDWVVLAKPSDLTIKRGHRGRVLFKVTVRGRGSHASRPDLGENAITAAARLIFLIDLLSTSLATDPFLGSGTIAVTHIESQSASPNAIPDACTFYVDRRLTLGETAGRAQSQIESVIEREGIEASVEIMEYQSSSYLGHTFRTREAYNAWILDDDHPLIHTLSQSAQTILNRTTPTGHWSFSSDGVYSMAEARIPTVGFGPGDPDTIHTIKERVRLDDVAAAAQIYALLAAKLLSK
jgi:putative selenium metabolism hydrolase